MPAPRPLPRASADLVLRRLERSAGPPCRLPTARDWLDGPSEGMGSRAVGLPTEPIDLDPAVALLGPLAAGPKALGRHLRDAPWWRAEPDSAPALDRLWRHAVGLALLTRRLAAEQGLDDAGIDAIGRLALLAHLPLWGLAAVDPAAAAALIDAHDAEARQVACRDRLGLDLPTLALEVAGRWQVDEDLADAAWLLAHPTAGLDRAARDPGSFALLRRAASLLESTPLRLGLPIVPSEPLDPAARRWLLARVGSLCAEGLAGRPLDPREEGRLRDHLRARLRLADLDSVAAPEDVVPIESQLAQLKSDRDRLQTENDRLRDRLARLAEAHHRADADSRESRQSERLEALAEFAAGAGHELNNPLAVILGRAQLLMGRTADPSAVRSLRAIIGQAQRAHRILRDLIYVARPPQPRPRPCTPDELARACVRDLQDEANARGVRLSLDPEGLPSLTLVDPDALRHALETLIRNALEAAPSGGLVSIAGRRRGGQTTWTVNGDGRSLRADEAEHLFDPFFCGREAGRGLGLGLPRVARAVALQGGDVTWSSPPGSGARFTVSLPVETVPKDAP